MEKNNYSVVMEKLRLELPQMPLDKEIKDILDNKHNVLNRFGEIFSKENIQYLTEEQFRSFLSFRENHHWTGLKRHPEIYADMTKLRCSLAYLLDEEKPIEERIDQVLGKNIQHGVPGMGIATATAVLLVTFPEKYGVCNGASIKALDKINLWPFSSLYPSTINGQKYKKINDILLSFASDLKVDLWTLDAIWWLPTFHHK